MTTITVTSVDGPTKTCDVRVYPEVAALPVSGSGSNEYDLHDLLQALQVGSVGAAIEELHYRALTGTMGNLKLGMYLDLPSLTPTDGNDDLLEREYEESADSYCFV
jgi:hypothetical protein